LMTVFSDPVIGCAENIRSISSKIFLVCLAIFCVLGKVISCP
jgi:hypothetical protein